MHCSVVLPAGAGLRPHAPPPGFLVISLIPLPSHLSEAFSFVAGCDIIHGTASGHRLVLPCFGGKAYTKRMSYLYSQHGANIKEPMDGMGDTSAPVPSLRRCSVVQAPAIYGVELLESHDGPSRRLRLVFLSQIVDVARRGTEQRYRGGAGESGSAGLRGVRARRDEARGLGMSLVGRMLCLWVVFEG
jgi:hypothetical protein